MVANAYAPVIVEITVSRSGTTSSSSDGDGTDPNPDYSIVMSNGKEVVSNGATVIITNGD